MAGAADASAATAVDFYYFICMDIFYRFIMDTCFSHFLTSWCAIFTLICQSFACKMNGYLARYLPTTLYLLLCTVGLSFRTLVRKGSTGLFKPENVFSCICLNDFSTIEVSYLSYLKMFVMVLAAS